MVNKFNNSVFGKCSSSHKVTIQALDSILGDLAMATKDKILLTVSTDPSRTAALHNPLSVAPGLRFEIVANLDVDDGLTNGSGCVLKHIEYRMSTTARPSILWVQFDNETVGKNHRRKYRAMYSSPNVAAEWTPVFDIKRKFSVRRNVNAVRIQFPLRPAAAKTVHKAQGETLSKLVVHLGSTRRDHIHYVALSRVQSLENLHILELNEDKIATSESVEKEIDRLRQDATVQLCYTPLYKMDPNTFKIVFHNARSFHAHFQDILADENFIHADVVAFAESRLKETDAIDMYSLEPFIPLRNDEKVDATSKCRPYHGLITFIKAQHYIFCFNHFSSVSLEFTFLKTGSVSNPIQIVFLYRSGAFSFEMFKGLMTKELLPIVEPTMNLIIMGDFNFDVSDKVHVKLQEYMQTNFKCQNIMTSTTTDQGSTIDLMFTNMDNVSTAILECPWSDHKAIVLSMTNNDFL